MSDIRRIVVTPAGRERCISMSLDVSRCLSILRVYIERAKKQGTIDEWHLWLNTNVESDIQYIRSLPAICGDWVRVFELEKPVNKIDNNSLYTQLIQIVCMYG
jgi:hypothetical protein